MRWVASILIALGISAVVALGGLWMFQRRMLFQPPPTPSVASPPGGSEVLRLQVGNDEVEAWLLPPSGGFRRPAPLLLFAHGNAEAIDGLGSQFDEPRRWGMGVLLVEYPGYGRSGGAPTESSIGATMTAAFDRMAADVRVDGDRIVGFGRSLGAGAVTLLGTHRPVSALLLQSGFRSVRAMARSMMLPGALVRDPFDNEAALRASTRPVLILHGERDTIVPVAHAHALQRAAEGAEMFLMECGHNDCPPSPGPYWQRIRDFLTGHDILP